KARDSFVYALIVSQENLDFKNRAIFLTIDAKRTSQKLDEPLSFWYREIKMKTRRVFESQ
ncbi:MAG: hypothetical protein J6X44_03965, partial [Thermoguttaceae bacterium]|nr:hypothetical protein [Thermoguttaceae bacterium]